MAVDDECQVGGEGGGRSQSPRSSLRASDWSALLRSINSNYEAVIGLMGRLIISLQDRIDFRLDGRGWGGREGWRMFCGGWESSRTAERLLKWLSILKNPSEMLRGILENLWRIFGESLENLWRIFGNIIRWAGNLVQMSQNARESSRISKNPRESPRIFVHVRIDAEKSMPNAPESPKILKNPQESHGISKNLHESSRIFVDIPRDAVKSFLNVPESSKISKNLKESPRIP